MKSLLNGLAAGTVNALMYGYFSRPLLRTRVTFEWSSPFCGILQGATEQKLCCIVGTVSAKVGRLDMKSMQARVHGASKVDREC